MDFTQYINPTMAALIPVLYVIGMIMKQLAIPDKWIPAVLALLSVLLAIIWTLAEGMPFADAGTLITAIITGLIQGVLYAGTAVFTNQLIKQAGKSE